jgi:hypothetical protein
VDFGVTAHVNNHADGVVCIPKDTITCDKIAVRQLDLHVAIASYYALEAVQVVVGGFRDYVPLEKL